MTTHTMRYFNGDQQLHRINVFGNSVMGVPIGTEPLFVQGKGYTGYVKADRKVMYKEQAPSLHVCDDRCMNAKGRVMKCECSCGGKNHGRGTVARLTCEEI